MYLFCIIQTIIIIICVLDFIQYDRIQDIFMLFVFKENLIKLKIANDNPMLVTLLLISN